MPEPLACSGLGSAKLETSAGICNSLHAVLPKPRDKQVKGSQLGQKSVTESSRGTGVHGSPHQVLSFPSHHSPEWGEKISNLFCSLR